MNHITLNKNGRSGRPQSHPLHVYIYMGPFEKGGGIFYLCMSLFSGHSENSGYNVSCDVRYVRIYNFVKSLESSNLRNVDCIGITYYRNSLFFRLVNFHRKNIRVKKFSDRPNWTKIFYKSRVVGINWGDRTACRRDGLWKGDCCVRGYHEYKDIEAAAIGEVLVCSTEPTNAQKFSLGKIIFV